MSPNPVPHPGEVVPSTANSMTAQPVSACLQGQEVPPPFHPCPAPHTSDWACGSEVSISGSPLPQLGDPSHPLGPGPAGLIPGQRHRHLGTEPGSPEAVFLQTSLWTSLFRATRQALCPPPRARPGAEPKSGTFQVGSSSRRNVTSLIPGTDHQRDRPLCAMPSVPSPGRAASYVRSPRPLGPGQALVGRHPLLTLAGPAVGRHGVAPLWARTLVAPWHIDAAEGAKDAGTLSTLVDVCRREVHPGTLPNHRARHQQPHCTCHSHRAQGPRYQ